MSKKVGTIIIVVLMLVFGYIGYDYLHYRSVNAVSDAAFVKTDSLTTVSFKVKGRIKTMPYIAGDIIKKGEVVARLETIDYELALQKVQHQAQALQKTIAAQIKQRKRTQDQYALKQAIDTNEVINAQKNIRIAQSNVKASETELNLAKLDLERYKRLAENKLIALHAYEQQQVKYTNILEQTDAAKEKLKQAKVNKANAIKQQKLNDVEMRVVDELSDQIAANEQQLKAYEKQIEELQKNIEYCSILAPFDGVIAKRYANDMEVVKAGQAIYDIVDPANIHVEVLLAEDKLPGVHVGNSVSLTFDALPDDARHGTVDKIDPASAATFSLVPRDIASGEFTKLAQRFVIRIKVHNIEGLRTGMSSTIAIKRTGN